jgi:hypothetical protein
MRNSTRVNYYPFTITLLFIFLFFNFDTSKGHSMEPDPLLNMDRPSQSCLQSEGFFTCTDHSKCIQMDHVCDNIDDCTDHSDEGGLCQVHCSEKCLFKCHPTPRGPYCLCPPGRQLDKGNVTCSDIDECSLWPPLCDQLCANSPGSFSCSCSPGYSLDDDQIHCFADPDQPGKATMIYTQGATIMRISVGHGAASSPEVIYHGRGLIFALALDTHENRIFWYDSKDKEISAMELNDDFRKISIHRVITNGLMMVNSMSYDWLSKNLYIGDALLHRILVCSVDTDLCASIFKSNVLHVPRSLTVDPIAGKLYWSECGTSHRIESSSLDGSNIRTLAAHNIKCPASLVIDQPQQILYWVDPELQLIEAVSTQDAVRMNLHSKHVPYPLSLAIFEEDLYVTYRDQSRTSINMAISDKFDFEEGHEQMFLQLNEVPSDLQIFHSVLQTPGTSPCRGDPCVHGICLPVDRTRFRCVCPSGRRLTSDEQHCVWNMSEPSLVVANGNQLVRILPDSVGAASHVILQLKPQHNVTALTYDVTSQTIFFADTFWSSGTLRTALKSFKLNSNELSEARTIFEDVGKISDISVDWFARNIYWTNVKQGTVEMSRLNGSSRAVILNNNSVTVPTAISVDPTEGKLYYSDCGHTSHMKVCDLGGQDCVQPLGGTTGCVSDLLMDTQGHELYWTDSTVGQISVADLTGFKATEIRHSPEPLSIAMLADSLFWVDSHYGDVLRQSKSDPYHESRIKLSLKPLTSLVSLDGDSQPTGTNGCSGAHYGGCSHLCVAKSRMQSSCLCPSHLQLAPDQMTCTQRKESLSPSFVHNSDNHNDHTPNHVNRFNSEKHVDPPVNHIVPIPYAKPADESVPRVQPPYEFDPQERPVYASPLKERPGYEWPSKEQPEYAYPSKEQPEYPYPSKERPGYESFPNPRPANEPFLLQRPAYGLFPNERPRTTTQSQSFNYVKCPYNYCFNNGDCHHVFDQLLCSCKDGWTGKYCEISMALISSSPSPASFETVSSETVSLGSSHAWAGVVCFALLLLLVLLVVVYALVVFFRARSRLREGEVLTLDHLRSSALLCRNEPDPTTSLDEKLLHGSISDLSDGGNIYNRLGDVADNKYHKSRSKASIGRPKSNDAAQSSRSSDKQQRNDGNIC